MVKPGKIWEEIISIMVMWICHVVELRPFWKKGKAYLADVKRFQHCFYIIFPTKLPLLQHPH